MDKEEILKNFYELKKAVEDYKTAKEHYPDKVSAIYYQIIELYGKIAYYYTAITGDLQIEVPDGGTTKTIDKYSNYFEAGFLSGRTIHRHQAHTELIKVIGLFECGALDQKEKQVQLSTILLRFRPCCNFIRFQLESERDVQDILWIMLRANFTRVEREETLKRFGLKNYRPDFGIPELKSLIEVKFINDRTDPKKIQEEILADVEGYLNKNGEYKDIYVFIYDKAHKLMDPENLITDLKGTPYITDVIVIPGLSSSVA